MAIRSFIAIETPPHVRNAMAEVQAQLKTSNADVRWESNEKLHATIKFLGNFDESTLPSLIKTIEQLTKTTHPFEVTFMHIGCFPSINRPRVIWVGCENRDGTLLNLKHNLDSALQSFGFEIENQEFHPHVTVGRVKSLRGIKALIPMLQTITFVPYSVPCNEILLMKSALKPQGSEYSVIRRFLLS